MQLLQDTKRLLNKPYPMEESIVGVIKIISAVSIFVAGFLYIFTPFDLNQMESGQLLVCLGFGLVTFLTSIVYEFTIVRWFKIKGKAANFTFGKWILYIIGLMLCISVANFLYIRITYFGYIKWEFLPHMIKGTFMVGIFPTVGLGVIALLRQERKYQDIAEEINQEMSTKSERVTTEDSVVFDIPSSKIRYIEALQNYVRIGHLNADGQWVEKTERATLKSILSEAKGSALVKCHRSFLINRKTIISTSGNAQGLLLQLADCDKTIPVSRSFVGNFR